ncbi:MAG: mechanosensitive ion channel [Opitutaceae bacterium]|nr:mechanosensitive ion channel [Cytophagales bacterium]
MDIDKFYDKSLDWILLHGPKILTGIVILIIGQWLIKVIKNWLGNFFIRQNVNASLAPFLLSLIATSLQVLLIVAVMQVMGIQMTIFAAIIASFGVAAGLALSGTLQNFACGVLILLLRPFKVGDNILAQGQDGIVSSIQIFYTILTTFDNKTVIIPNGKLSNELIINLSRQGKRRLDIQVKFPFTSDLLKIQEVIKLTVDKTENLLKDPSINIGVSSIEPDGFIVIVEVWVDALNYNQIKNAFQQQLLLDFKAAELR